MVTWITRIKIKCNSLIIEKCYIRISSSFDTLHNSLKTMLWPCKCIELSSFF